jgi:hypothetical protein
MAIHGIVSTYFGDLEFDIGKSLNWTKPFCDTMYVMDINTADSSRQYVVDWDRSFPSVKKSFFSQYSFLTNPTTAKNWRKESFNRAKTAWNYDSNDWVMFIDGTEGLNAYHAPPTTFDIDSAALVSQEDSTVSTITFTTATNHGAVEGNTLRVTGAFVTATVNSIEVTIDLSGSYLVTDAPSSTEVSVEKDFGAVIDIVDTPLDITAHGYLTTEPPGYFGGDVFKCWIQAEIDAAIADSKNFISLDGWALIRSGVPTDLVLTMSQPGLQSNAATATTCEEYYVPMGSMIRIAKVSSLNNPAFNWLSIDQPEESFANAYPADKLSLISYSYVRWSDNPVNMTQAVDSGAPNYVTTSPPLRPTAIEYDTGYAMRRLISQVRPLDGVPIEPEDWADPDPDGEQPTVDSYKKLDLIYVENEIYVDEEFAYSGYRPYGGSPLYPGILRSNLREGVWYTNQGPIPVTISCASASATGGVVTIDTGIPHYLSVGSKVSIYGTDPNFDGAQIIETVPTSRSFTFSRDIDDVASTNFPIGQAITMPAPFGPIPWNYLLNTFGIDNPSQWIKYSGPRTV